MLLFIEEIFSKILTTFALIFERVFLNEFLQDCMDIHLFSLDNTDFVTGSAIWELLL